MTDAVPGLPDDLRPDEQRHGELEPTDGQLLRQLIDRRDTSAFETLLRRHGPMVMGVCRRVLRDVHDAEDAFQATFLQLYRKPHSIVHPELVANWLYGVAFHRSLKARSVLGRRRVHERPIISAVETPAKAPDRDHLLWLDLQPLLDEELSNLPDEYRAPIVLCDLEGKTIKAAAAQLDCPQGTLAGRLSKARDMLAQMLKRRGLVLSAATLAVLVTRETASAAVPEATVQSTVATAASGSRPIPWSVACSSFFKRIQSGASTAMSAARFKLVASVVLAFGVGTLSLAGLAKVHNDSQNSAAATKAVQSAERWKAEVSKLPGPTTVDGFIVALGEYSIFDGTMKLSAVGVRGVLNWEVGYPPSPPHNTTPFFMSRGTDTLIDAPWFVFAESPQQFWLFDGKDKLHRHTYTFKDPAPGDNRGKFTGITGSSMATARVDLTHERELLALNPPQPVLERLQRWLNPEAVPRQNDAFITGVGEYKLYGGDIIVKVWDNKEFYSWSMHTKGFTVPHGGTSAGIDVPEFFKKGQPGWFLFPDEHRRVWSFDGKDQLFRHEVIENPPTVVQEKSVTKINTWMEAPTRTLSLPNDPKLDELNTPSAVRERIEKVMPLQEGYIVAAGEYRFFNSTTVKVWKRDGFVYCTVSLPQSVGKAGLWSPAVKLPSDQRWKIFVESPERIWSFNGWQTVGRHLLHVGDVEDPHRKDKLHDIPTVTSVENSFVEAKITKQLWQWNPPDPVAKWTIIARKGQPPERGF